MPEPLDDQVSAVREFNRRWTKIAGLLDAGLLETPHTLTEARVIYELAQADRTDLSDLRRHLDLDAGYLSRIVARLKEDRLVATQFDEQDARRLIVHLTTRGRSALRLLDERASAQVRELLDPVSSENRDKLVAAMGTIEAILDGPRDVRSVVIRGLRPGDLGWVVHRHGVLYADEYGFDETFEAIVARIVSDYVDNHDPSRDNAWIAEVDGSPAGCVFCIRKDDDVAQLRLFLVEPTFRGLGIGTRLVEECLRFARRNRYAKIMLWTQSILVAARRVYETAGFRLVEEDPHQSFGNDLVAQVWELDLASRT